MPYLEDTIAVAFLWWVGIAQSEHTVHPAFQDGGDCEPVHGELREHLRG